MSVKRGMYGFVDQCLDAANNDPLIAVAYAARVTRWKLIAEGHLDPAPDEELPLEVRRARRANAEHLAA